MIERRFGESTPFSVGIEEELFVIDPTTLAPAPFPEEGFDGVRVKPELFTTQVELTTGVCGSAHEALAELDGLRAAAARTAAAAGLVLAASGTWPVADSGAQPVTDDPALRAFVEYAGPSARRQYVAGLHVHVGVVSPEACMAALEGVLPWLPVLLAASCNSPYLDGRETGLASTRAEVLGLLPRAGGPPPYASFADWEAFAERLVGLGLADSYRRIWWDVRPHPALGTLEVRIADQPGRTEVSAAIAAVVRALVAQTAAEARPAVYDRGLYAQNRWAASRFGIAAGLAHPAGDGLARADDLLAELLDRLEPTMRGLGDASLAAPLVGLDQAGDQRVRGRAGGLAALCRELAGLA